MESGDQRSDERSRTSARRPTSPYGRRPRGTASVAAGAGIQFAISILVFLFLGQWLDRRLGTAPVFLLVCVFLGAGGSFYSMYRQLMAAQRREAEHAAAEQGPQAPGAGKSGG